MEGVGVATLIMVALAGGFGVVLAASYYFLRVQEDPRVEAVTGMMPGNNCGACGEPGCSAFATQVVAGALAPAKCTVATPDTRKKIADFLGVDVGSAEKVVARLKCAGGEGNVKRLAPYEGLASCRAAVLVGGGGRACAWGCLGLADCEKACTFKAIRMNARGLPVVTPDACTACGDCVKVCPLDLFVLVPEAQRLFVQCSIPLTGAAATARCSVACDACGRCAADAPKVIEMAGGLPRIHYDRGVLPTPAATFRCPTGAIQWIEGEQFEEDEREDPQVPRRIHA